MAMGLEGFDVRPIFVSKILNHSGISPITGAETTIAKNKDILLKIEEKYSEELNNKPLISLLNSVSPYVGYRDAIFFLLDSYDEDEVEDALLTLQAALRSEKKLSANDLITILKEAHENSISPHIMVNLFGEEAEEELQELNDNYNNLNHLKNLNNNGLSYPTKSGLNIDAMNDFK